MRRKELLICSVSGGKDSTALYCLMVEYFGQNFLPIFADTIIVSSLDRHVAVIERIIEKLSA